MKMLLPMLCSAIVVLASCSQPSPINRNETPPVTFTRNANESEDKNRITSASVGATQLTRLDAFPEKYRQACEVVAQELIKGNENPAEFYAEIEPARRAVVFHLWHETAFRAENAGVVGNPGGKCRDVHYDLRQLRVTKKGYWQ